MKWIKGKQYFQFTLQEMLEHLDVGKIVFTVLDLDAYVDVAKWPDTNNAYEGKRNDRR